MPHASQDTTVPRDPVTAAPVPVPDGRAHRLRRLGDVWVRHGERITLVVLVLCQAGTVALTWNLWNVRTEPPPLPLIDALPEVATAWALIVTLAVALWRPRIGAVLHLGVLAYAVMLDQTRLQPGVVSLAILLVALAFPPLTVVGRAHLVTLWTWSGIHKLLSTGFAGGSAVFMADGLGVPLGVTVWATPLAELTLGLVASMWRTRRIAVAQAVLVHGAILFTLIAQDWNSSVWLWNLALPFAAAHFLLTGRNRQLVVLRHENRRAAVASAVVWLVAWSYPAGFYVGAADTYLAHNLYTSNTRTATVCQLPAGAVASGSAPCVSPFDWTWIALNVPLPPEPRLYRQWFEATCSPGGVLRITPIRTRITPETAPVEFACPPAELSR